MPIDPNLKAQVTKVLEDYCEKKVPMRVREKVRLVHRWRGTKVMLVEERPYWKDDTAPWIESPVAQFRYHDDTNDWTLYWRDRNQRWHFYEPHPGSRSINRLLAEVDQDPTGIFWG
jgi:hypothetical protein